MFGLEMSQANWPNYVKTTVQPSNQISHEFNAAVPVSSPSVPINVNPQSESIHPTDDFHPHMPNHGTHNITPVSTSVYGSRPLVPADSSPSKDISSGDFENPSACGTSKPVQPNVNAQGSNGSLTSLDIERDMTAMDTSIPSHRTTLPPVEVALTENQPTNSSITEAQCLSKLSGSQGYNHCERNKRPAEDPVCLEKKKMIKTDFDMTADIVVELIKTKKEEEVLFHKREVPSAVKKTQAKKESTSDSEDSKINEIAEQELSKHQEIEDDSDNNENLAISSDEENSNVTSSVKKSSPIASKNNDVIEDSTAGEWTGSETKDVSKNVDVDSITPKSSQTSTPLRIKLRFSSPRKKDHRKTTDEDANNQDTIEVKKSTAKSKSLMDKFEFHKTCDLCEYALELVEEDGDNKLIYDGYRYTKSITRDDSIHWVCCEQSEHDCKGSLITNKTCTKVKSGNTHCHRRISSITVKSCPVAAYSYMPDAEIEYVRTRQGGKKLVFDGYTYTKKCTKSRIIRWECSGRRGFNCNGTVNTDIDGDLILGFNIHTHPPSVYVPEIFSSTPPKRTQKQKKSAARKDSLKELVDEIERNTSMSKNKKGRTLRKELTEKETGLHEYSANNDDEENSSVDLKIEEETMKRCLKLVLDSSPRKSSALSYADLNFHSDCSVCESSLKVVDDEKGQGIMMHDGYNYSKSSLIKGILYWSCASRKTLQCKGTISTDIECKIVLSCAAHSHPQNFSEFTNFISCPVVSQSIFTDAEIESVASGKGGKKLVVRGYAYTKKCGKLSSIRWECSKRKALKCRGSITTDTDCERIVAFSTHSHPDIDNNAELMKPIASKKDSSFEKLMDSAASALCDLKSSHESTTNVDLNSCNLPATVVVNID